MNLVHNFVVTDITWVTTHLLIPATMEVVKLMTSLTLSTARLIVVVMWRRTPVMWLNWTPPILTRLLWTLTKMSLWSFMLHVSEIWSYVLMFNCSGSNNLVCITSTCTCTYYMYVYESVCVCVCVCVCFLPFSRFHALVHVLIHFLIWLLQGDSSLWGGGYNIQEWGTGEQVVARVKHKIC